jgi:hypothetical protein
MDELEKARATVALLRRRVDELPAELTRAKLAPLPELPAAARDAGIWIVSGIGASEGPARLLVAELASAGVPAIFHPVTSFLGDTSPQGAVLVVVSQRLSPNARLPLRHRGRYGATILVTTLDPAADEQARALAAEGVCLVVHGPVTEDGLLLRVQGPAVANLMVLRLALAVRIAQSLPKPAWASALEGFAPNAAEHEALPSDALFDPIAFVACGEDVSLACGLRHKLLEGLGSGEPHIWDGCGIVHGPLQSFYERRQLLLALLRTGDEPTLGVFARLEKVLDPTRHRMLVLRATLPGPLALFELDLALDALLVGALEVRPRDLGNWPGKGVDAPIYELDGEHPPDRR